MLYGEVSAMGNLIRTENSIALAEAFALGASIREAARIAKVYKNTAHSFLRRMRGEENLSLCCSISQPERKAIWEAMGRNIPDGQRLGWSCSMAYCGDIEHMMLAEDRNYKKRNWKPYTSQVRLLSVGEFAEFERLPPDEMNRLRCVLQLSAGCFCSIRTSKDGKTFRIYRTGEWEYNGGSIEQAQELAKQSPVVYFAPPIQRPIPTDRPHCGYLGLLAFDSVHRDTLHLDNCRWKGCVFPAEKSGECWRHKHFFEFQWSMEWRAVDRSDVWPTEDNPNPLLSTMFAGELPTSAERTKVECKGQWNKGWQLSEDWWNDNVLKVYDDAFKAKEVPQVTVTVSMEPTVWYAPEKSIAGIRSTMSVEGGRFKMRRGGHSHSGSKTTKGRRKAASRSGIGSRHSTKEKRWSRETIEELERQADELLIAEFGEDVEEVKLNHELNEFECWNEANDGL